jgi:hypothetical protein
MGTRNSGEGQRWRRQGNEKKERRFNKKKSELEEIKEQRS